MAIVSTAYRKLGNWRWGIPPQPRRVTASGPVPSFPPSFPSAFLPLPSSLSRFPSFLLHLHFSFYPSIYLLTETRSPSGAQAALEPMTLPPQPSKCGDSRCHHSYFQPLSIEPLSSLPALSLPHIFLVLEASTFLTSFLSPPLTHVKPERESKQPLTR